MRSNCEAKVPIISRPDTVLMMSPSVWMTRFSGIEKPSFSAFVESAMKNIFLSFASAPQVCRSRSVGIPSSWSSFRSPVMTTFPCGVSMEQPIESGMECVTGKDKRDTTDVVKVAVRNDDAFHATRVLLEVFCVGEDVVNARRSVFRDELEARVKDEYVAGCADLNGSHIASHFLNAPKRDNTDRCWSCWLGGIVGGAIDA